MKTYKVYVRWPGQRVSDTTTTEIHPVANYALQHLLREYAGQDCAVSMTYREPDDTKATNLIYQEMADVVYIDCPRCDFAGIVENIDDVACPRCGLI